MKHKLQINVAAKEGTNKVLEGATTKISSRKAKRLFGKDFCTAICLRPGLSVQSIVIQEVEDDRQK